MGWLSMSMMGVSICGAFALAACGNSSATGGGGSGGSSTTTTTTNTTTTTSTGTTTGSGGDAQTPPQGAANVQAWLAKGDYKKWKCESAIHASRSPSPHGFNRICSNDLVANSATATTDWAQGAAGVKELYASANDTTPVGYAVYLKTAADSAAGANWYWYEQVPADSAAPHDAKGIVADGMGGTGPAKDICVGCHVAAGADAAHTPTPNGRDFVYTAVH